jgi:hypothetical protein
VIRPFTEELTHRISEIANIPSPEVRMLQAIPADRLPGENETRIFLSHKTADKNTVRLYHKTLKQLGLNPWLDEDAMPVGTNLERGIAKGFEESCAAIFFITEKFKDERYIASEIDYAIAQKRQKNQKFAIITLLFGEGLEVPVLLRPYVYAKIDDNLAGIYEILRALPVELGPERWKESAVK